MCIRDSELTGVSASDVDWADVTNKSVINSEIADETIESGKIKDGTIVDGDVNASAAIAFSKLNIGAGDIRGLSPYSGGTGVSVGGDGEVTIGQSVATTVKPNFSGLSVSGTEVINSSGQWVGQSTGLSPDHE